MDGDVVDRKDGDVVDHKDGDAAVGLVLRFSLWLVLCDRISVN